MDNGVNETFNLQTNITFATNTKKIQLIYGSSFFLPFSFFFSLVKK